MSESKKRQDMSKKQNKKQKAAKLTPALFFSSVTWIGAARFFYTFVALAVLGLIFSGVQMFGDAALKDIFREILGRLVK